MIIYRAPKKKEKHFEFYHSLLWSSTGVLFIWWIILYITEIVKTSMWGTDSKLELAFNILWLVIAVVIIPILSCCVNCRNDINLLSPGLAMVLCSPWFKIVCVDDVPNKYIEYETKSEKIKLCGRQTIGAFPLVTFYFSAGFVIINIVPVVLYFLIHPVRVLAFYSAILTALILFVFVVTAVDFERKKDKQKQKPEGNGHKNKTVKNNMLIKVIKRVYASYLPWLTIFFIIFLAILFAMIYRTLVSGGSTGHSLYNLFKALIPTLILGSPAVWAGKKLKKYYLEGDKSTQTDELNTTNPTNTPADRSSARCQGYGTFRSDASSRSKSGQQDKKGINTDPRDENQVESMV